MNINQNDVLEIFGEKLIDSARDATINNAIKTIRDDIKDSSSKLIAEKLASLSPSQMDSVIDLIIDSVDGALNNFLWLLEQEDEIDLVTYKNGETYSLKDISDGLSADYWNFVDEFSKHKRLD